MKPRGLLMAEHRLIEKMIEIIRQKIPEIEKTNKIAPVFLDTTIDFFRFYADKIHHGKEEDILFRDCRGKNMREEDIKDMDDLIEDHKIGRKIIDEIEDAREKRDVDIKNIIIEKLKTLIELYSNHFKKEDMHFFPNSEKYFTENELQLMIREFEDCDRKMIQEKYRLAIENLR
jgi:hemerythrin-like domain-containing protein